MANYEVIGGPVSLTVEGTNWLAALGAALPLFDLDKGAVGRLVINVQNSGAVLVDDPISGRSFKLVPAAERERLAGSDTHAPALKPPPALVMPSQSLLQERPAPPKVAPKVVTEDAVARIAQPVGAFERSSLPAPAAPSREEHKPVPVPAAAKVEDDRPADLIEDLFDRTFDIQLADGVGAACREALAILRDLVPCEAGAVLYGDINSVGLTFVAAYGNKADKLIGQTLSFESGVAGFSHRHGIGLILPDTTIDERHDKSVDDSTGFRTRNILVAPILSPGGHTYGCLELLNAANGFRDWHLEAAQMVGATLADFVSRREGVDISLG